MEAVVWRLGFWWPSESIARDGESGREDGAPDSCRVRVQPRAVRYWWISSGVRAEFPGVSSRVVPRWRWTWWIESWMGEREAVRAAIWGMTTSTRVPSAWP